MAKSLLNQFTQTRGSRTYDDALTMSWAETAGRVLDSGQNATINDTAVTGWTGTAFTDGSVGNYIVVGSSAYAITAVTDGTTCTIQTSGLSGSQSNVGLYARKNLEDDLNYVRTQLRLAIDRDNWYDAPRDIVTAISGTSTDDQVPTSQAVYELVDTVSGVITSTISALDHDEDLNGLNGGDGTDYWHLDANTYNAISSDGTTLTISDNVDATGNVNVSGTLAFDGGNAVNNIVTSMTAPGSNDNLMTEAAIYNWVNTVSGAITSSDTFIGLEDTYVTSYTANNMLYTSTSGVHDTSDMTYDPATGDIRIGGSSSPRFETSVADSRAVVYGDADTYLVVSGTSGSFVDNDELVFAMTNETQQLGKSAGEYIIIDNATNDDIEFGISGSAQMTIDTNGVTLATGASVNDITTAITAPGDDDTLATEKAIVDYITTVSGNVLHNNRPDLQGGNGSDEYYHLDASDYNDRITATEVDTISGSLQSQITQNASDISSNYTTLDTKIDTASGTLQSQIDSNDTDISNLDSKIDTTSGTLQAEIDGLNHNTSLAGLQGGNGSDEYYHLDANTYNAFSSDGTTLTINDNIDATGNVNVSGTLSFDGGTAVNDISTSLTAPGDDTTLLTEAAIYNWVNTVSGSLQGDVIWEIVDTPTTQIRPKPEHLSKAIYTEGNVTIGGNLTVTGTLFYADTQTVQVEDNLMVINYGEVGAGVTAGEAGIQVDRGSETDYMFLFDEGTDTFRIGVSGTQDAFNLTSLQPVATREDNPIDHRVAWWDADSYTFRTQGDTYMTLNSGTDTFEIVTPDSYIYSDGTYIAFGDAAEENQFYITTGGKYIGIYNDNNDVFYSDASSGQYVLDIFGAIGGTEAMFREDIASIIFYAGTSNTGNYHTEANFMITPSGIHVAKSQAYIDEILNTVDGDSIDASSTDNQLATAKLIYTTYSGLENAVGGTPTYMYYVDSNGDISTTAALTYDPDPAAQNGGWGDDAGEFVVASGTDFIITEMADAFRDSGDDYLLLGSDRTNESSVTDRASIWIENYSDQSGNQVGLYSGSTSYPYLEVERGRIIAGRTGTNWIEIDETNSNIQFGASNGTVEMTLDANGMSLKSGASVNEILDSTDAIDASSTDDQLATAKLIYNEISTLSGTVGALTYLNLTDTPSSYSSGQWAYSTTSGVIWASITESDITDLDKYSTSYIDSMESSIYSSISSVSGTLQSQIDTNASNISSNDTDISNLQSDLATTSGTLQSEIDAITQVYADTEEPTGFVTYKVGSTLSYSGTEVTISGTYDYYIKGTKYSKSGADSVNITDGSEGLQYVYFDGETLTHSTSFTNDILSDYAYVAALYWDDTNNEIIYFGDERHGIIMDSATHLNMHLTRGTQYISGLGLSDLTVDGGGSSDNDAKFGVGSGVILDEDLFHSISATASGSTIPVFYRDGASGDWRSDTNTGYAFLEGATPLPKYNLYSGGNWTQPEVASTDFVLYHIFATNDPDQPIVSIMGQNTYGSNTLARLGAADELQSLQLGGMPFVEFVALATVIIEGDTGFTNSVNAQIISTDGGDDYIDWRYAEVTSGAGTAINDHGNLSGLTDPDHPATAIYTDTTNFDGALSVADDTVQKALDTLDNAIAGTAHDHFELDLVYEGSNVWDVTNANVADLSTANMDVYLNGLLNRDNDGEYFTATVSGTTLTVTFAYNTYENDWAHVKFWKAATS